MTDRVPIMYVFAGNNGSGKSTIRSLIIDRMGVSINIDPDAIARRIDPINPEKQRVSAGKEVIRLVRNCILQQNDFSIETTLAGRNAIRQMKEAKRNGFQIKMFYVGLGNPKLNIERVAIRVRNGGHHIASDDIMRRHLTSVQNLLDNLHYVDHLIVIDNSNYDGKVLFEYKEAIKFITNNLPMWVEPIVNTLNS